MQEFQPHLTDEEREQYRQHLDSITASPAAMDNKRALFNSLSKERQKMIEETQVGGEVCEVPQGTIKSVGGVDYQVTERGWKKIGLTKV